MSRAFLSNGIAASLPSQKERFGKLVISCWVGARGQNSRFPFSHVAIPKTTTQYYVVC